MLPAEMGVQLPGILPIELASFSRPVDRLMIALAKMQEFELFWPLQSQQSACAYLATCFGRTGGPQEINKDTEQVTQALESNLVSLWASKPKRRTAWALGAFVYQL